MRRLFFWLHLTVGCVAGIVILIMSFTGVLLAYQRQIIHWADREFRSAPAANAPRLAPEALLDKVRTARNAVPSALTVRSAPDEPVAAEFGRESVVYLDPVTGDVRGEGNKAVRAFFRSVEDWHRWLAATGESRDTGRTITGYSNLLFLGLVMSGAYLWLPKRWTLQHLRPSIWFRRGLAGKARDWNWHNTIGLWCFLPLFVIVLCAVVMSFPWANNLVYRVTSSELPTPNGPGRGGPTRGESRPASEVSFAGLNALWQQAEQRAPGWTTVSMRLPASAKAPVQFNLDSGDGGRPDLRSTLTLKRDSAEVVRWDTFDSFNAGRRLRSWIRFTHTGEAGGITGETIALIASLGAVVLVYTGISLAIRRLLSALARRESSARSAASVARV